MPTGTKHYVIRRENGPGSMYDEPCRCMIGHDHNPNGGSIFDSDLERWDMEEGRSRANPDCPACGGSGACALCEDD
ncbi:hypothetical protein GCM10023352_09280 [Rothia endophytica]|uniref:Molecular chaperone DnaJ n=1 Tax=Rothia endophytica TaxID=1324766 RepID=A0ABP9BDF4_9MICC